MTTSVCTVLLSIVFFVGITFGFQFPEVSDNSCRTTLGQEGRCLDIHLCQEVLEQIYREALYPQICSYDPKAKTISVCCRGDKPLQCGVSFPVASLIQSTSNHGSASELESPPGLRRPPEQEMLFNMAQQRYGQGDRRSKRSFKITPDLEFEAANVSFNLWDDEDRKASFPIFNGIEALKAEFPWMALVGKRVPFKITPHRQSRIHWFCGGALISDQWVITAAHCLGTKADLIRLGETDLDDREARRAIEFPSMDVGVAKVIKHPNYTRSSVYDDVGLIELKRPINFSRHIQPICLPGLGQPQLSSGSSLVSAGWGHDHFGGRPTLKLMKTVTLEYVPRQKCDRIFTDKIKSRLHMTQGINSKIICAHDLEHFSDPCQGDSGGGLLQFDPKSKRYFLIGIVSAGIGCGNERFPGLYSNVNDSMDWIQSIMGK